MQATFGTKMSQRELVKVMRSFGTVYDRINLDDFKQIVMSVARPERESTGRSEHVKWAAGTDYGRCKSTPHKRVKAERGGIKRRPSRGIITTAVPPEAIPRRSPLRPSHSYCKVQLTTPALRRFTSEP